MDFRTRRSPYLLILLYQNASKNTRNYGNILENYYFSYLNFLETQHVDISRKDGHRKMMKVQVNKSPKSWICISCLSKNMKWKFGNMYQIYVDPTRHKTRNLFESLFEILWVQNNWYLRAFSKNHSGVESLYFRTIIF